MPPRGPIPKPPTDPSRSHRRPRPVTFIPPADAPPDPPASLGPVGQEAWTRWWKSATWLVESDAPGLVLVCQMLDALEDIRLRIEADGRTTDGSKGQPVAHPLHDAQTALIRLFTALLSDYGLTPAGRRRLGIEVRAETPETRLHRLVESRYAHLADPYAHLHEDLDA